MITEYTVHCVKALVRAVSSAGFVAVAASTAVFLTQSPLAAAGLLSIKIVAVAVYARAPAADAPMQADIAAFFAERLAAARP